MKTTQTLTTSTYRVLDASTFAPITIISRDADDAVLAALLDALGAETIDWEDGYNKGLIMAGDTAVAVLKAYPLSSTTAGLSRRRPRRTR